MEDVKMEELKKVISIIAGLFIVVLLAVIATTIFGKLNFLGFVTIAFLSWIAFLVVTNWMLKK